MQSRCFCSPPCSKTIAPDGTPLAFFRRSHNRVLLVACRLTGTESVCVPSWKHDLRFIKHFNYYNLLYCCTNWDVLCIIGTLVNWGSCCKTASITFFQTSYCAVPENIPTPLSECELSKSSGNNFPLTTSTVETPLPLEISSDLHWGGLGYESVQEPAKNRTTNTCKLTSYNSLVNYLTTTPSLKPNYNWLPVLHTHHCHNFDYFLTYEHNSPSYYISV